MKVALILLALTISVVCAEKKIPENFLGKFEVTTSENFDEYLSAKGVGWLIRKMIQMASVTKSFEKSSNPGRYRIRNFTSKKDTDYENVELGKTFTAEGLDSTQHKITYDFDEASQVLRETHERIETDDKKPETYEYSMEGESLVMKMEHDGVVCKRFFKRV
ncbi:hypothetical protein L596_014886 [Steinernema carpocapsae]|uniref:Cytosolic fatty-acid binding proteins domain-containing protein n=1 Tax=Steinernema carpocapsae TaxID=34508 RepID=A0A4U5NDU3_STECR|nr:hypothetical protein L596_014886 [Steinernema carpocapsae]